MAEEMTGAITPMPNHVLLRAHEQKEVEGDIFIPETVERPVRLDYTVIGVGQTVRKEIPQLKLGCKVVIKKNHGVEVKYGEEVYTLVLGDDIEAICQ